MICPPTKLIWWKQFPWAPKSVQDGVIEGAWWRAAVLLAMQSCCGENLHHRDRQSNLPGPYSELAESSGQAAFSLISVFVQDGFFRLCNATYADMRETYFLHILAT